MNIGGSAILSELKQSGYLNQRRLAQNTGISLGKVNQALHDLQMQEYLDEKMQLTSKAYQLFKENRPRNAIILAAGYGMRMIPINMETPKGLLQIDGEVLIERMIRQLHEAGITDITVVVGFMKESYEYLIDEYSVKMVINTEYAHKNNLHSLALAKSRIGNTYIIPCDIWCKENPFSSEELYSWYSVCELIDEKSNIKVNRKQELVRINKNGNKMVGIAYITAETGEILQKRLVSMDVDSAYKDCFWEEALFVQDKMLAYARMMNADSVYEINTFEELRELDGNARQSKSKVIRLIADVLKVEAERIEEITVLKKGMTNRSFLFTCLGKRYIMRIPGEGTERLIERSQEYEVYKAIEGKEVGDRILYMNPNNGYKMTEYFEGARTCDAENSEDVKRCMKYLREFHKLGLRVEHEFDLWSKLEFYESLWEGQFSCYRDYRETKKNVYKLKKIINGMEKQWCLTHIDAVPDNFLFVKEHGNAESIRLIDWEYAAMQDPHVDIAMFCIYALYEREQIDNLIRFYFQGEPSKEIRIKIYCYIAVCGLIWSNWCEYKLQLGVEFGEYSLRQYRYAKEYYRIVKEELGNVI